MIIQQMIILLFLLYRLLLDLAQIQLVIVILTLAETVILILLVQKFLKMVQNYEQLAFPQMRLLVDLDYMEIILTFLMVMEITQSYMELFLCLI